MEMKTSDIGLVFDAELAGKPWVKFSFDEDAPDVLWFGTVPTTLGSVTLVGAGGSLCYLGFTEGRSLERVLSFFPKATLVPDLAAASAMAEKVMAIWEGRSRATLSMIVAGTPFQRSVWGALMSIPKGHVVSYGTVAAAIGNPRAVRAVGSAVGANPISLLIPCHRVVQQSGAIENYGWGDAMKRKILKAESI